MKRGFALSLTLALALSLLTACEMFAPDQMQTPNYAFGGKETGSPEEPGSSAGPTENEELGVDEYGFTVFPAGNYLADKKFDTDEFLPDYDADPSFIQFLSTSMFALCQTEDTIYSSRNGGLNQSTVIMYTDKATGISGPLCGRPECLHNDSNCSAYVPRRADGLCVYDGKLYWANHMSNIARMNLDGTGRETVASVGSMYDNISQGISIVFHRGYLYAAGSQHEVIENGVAKGSFTIKAVPLDGGEGFTILRRLVDGTGTQSVIKPVGSDLYIMLYYFDYEDKAEHKGVYDVAEFYRWDSKTRRAEFISSTQSSPDGLRIKPWSFHPVPGDGIYFQVYDVTEQQDINNVIYKYSFETETFEEGAWLNKCMWLSYCRDFIVTDQDRTVYTYDYDGNLLFRSDRVEGHALGNFVGADSKFAYFNSVDDDDYIAVPLNSGDYIAIK